MPSLSCIGAGRLGKTLCRLLSDHVHIKQVINQSETSSQRAIDFIGAGTKANMGSFEPADIWLIATPDNQIEASYKALLHSGVLQKGTIVFHCSGSLDCSILQSEGSQNFGASVHPIHSFANPALSVTSFAGTYCAIECEGEDEASEYLHTLFTIIGGLPFSIASQNKALYHTSTVMACNYLITLLESSQQMLSATGIKGGSGNPLESLIRQTLDNYLNTSASEALTGPIARGDSHTIDNHLKALSDVDGGQQWQQLYRQLGKATLPIAAEQGQASDEDLLAIKALLDSDK
jgi:predicted short-subunit dehydrogenase-like oxidoreductase (DUF2520 family)